MSKTQNRNIIDLQALSTAMRRRRLEERLSHRDLAERLGLARSARTLCAIEAGTRMPTAATLGALCRWLGAPVSRFVVGGRAGQGSGGGNQLPAIRAQIEKADIDREAKRFLVDLIEAGYRQFGKRNSRPA